MFLRIVIVTEKKNILLRYLHQQWEKKVRCVRGDITPLNSTLKQLSFTFYFQNPVKKRDSNNVNSSANSVAEASETAEAVARKRPRLEQREVN